MMNIIDAYETLYNRFDSSQEREDFFHSKPLDLIPFFQYSQCGEYLLRQGWNNQDRLYTPYQTTLIWEEESGSDPTVQSSLLFSQRIPEEHENQPDFLFGLNRAITLNYLEDFLHDPNSWFPAEIESSTADPDTINVEPSSPEEFYPQIPAPTPFSLQVQLTIQAHEHQRAVSKSFTFPGSFQQFCLSLCDEGWYTPVDSWTDLQTYGKITALSGPLAEAFPLSYASSDCLRNLILLNLFCNLYPAVEAHSREKLKALWWAQTWSLWTAIICDDFIYSFDCPSKDTETKYWTNLLSHYRLVSGNNPASLAHDYIDQEYHGILSYLYQDNPDLFWMSISLSEWKHYYQLGITS